MGVVAKLRGFDELDAKARRRKVRVLIDKGNDVSVSERADLDVLLLMGLGMTELEARQDVALRRRQNDRMKGKRSPPWMR